MANREKRAAQAAHEASGILWEEIENTSMHGGQHEGGVQSQELMHIFAEPQAAVQPVSTDDLDDITDSLFDSEMETPGPVAVCDAEGVEATDLEVPERTEHARASTSGGCSACRLGGVCVRSFPGGGPLVPPASCPCGFGGCSAFGLWGVCVCFYREGPAGAPAVARLTRG